MRIAACVIVYNPDQNLKANISTYLPFVDFLMIMDNSINNAIKDLYIDNKKVVYFWDGENKGISTRLNQSLQICEENNIDFLLTMDQDSAFEDNDMNKYLEVINSREDMLEIGMYGVTTKKTEKSLIENDILITSGSIINISIANNVGKFDEQLFIDEVDHEFCLRLFLNNFKTLKIGTIVLKHQFGESRKVLSPKLKNEYRSVYSPLRIYYITRNFLYVNNKYKRKIKLKKERLHGLLNRVKNTLLYSNTPKTIYYIFTAYVHYRLKIMGKFKPNKLFSK